MSHSNHVFHAKYSHSKSSLKKSEFRLFCGVQGSNSKSYLYYCILSLPTDLNSRWLNPVLIIEKVDGKIVYLLDGDL